MTCEEVVGERQTVELDKPDVVAVENKALEVVGSKSDHVVGNSSRDSECEKQERGTHSGENARWLPRRQFDGGLFGASL